MEIVRDDQKCMLPLYIAHELATLSARDTMQETFVHRYNGITHYSICCVFRVCGVNCNRHQRWNSTCIDFPWIGGFLHSIPFISMEMHINTHFRVKQDMKKHVATKSMPVSSFPVAICHFTLFDNGNAHNNMITRPNQIQLFGLHCTQCCIFIITTISAWKLEIFDIIKRRFESNIRNKSLCLPLSLSFALFLHVALSLLLLLVLSFSYIFVWKSKSKQTEKAADESIKILCFSSITTSLYW